MASTAGTPRTRTFLCTRAAGWPRWCCPLTPSPAPAQDRISITSACSAPPKTCSACPGSPPPADTPACGPRSDSEPGLPADRPPRSSCGHPAVVASLDDRESRKLRRLMARYVPGTVGRRGKALNAPARWRGRQCSASVSSGSGAVAARWPAAGPQGAWCGIGRRWVAGMSATNGAGSPADPAPGAVGPLPGPADQPDPGRSRRGQGTILDAIGDTPLVQVDGIWIKLEYLNPSGSIKARIAKYMIERAEREGLLRPGDTIVEASSGNTGNAMSMVAAVKGYRMLVVMPNGMSAERRGGPAPHRGHLRRFRSRHLRPAPTRHRRDRSGGQRRGDRRDAPPGPAAWA